MPAGDVSFCEKMSLHRAKARATPRHRMVGGPLPQPALQAASLQCRIKKRSPELEALKKGSCLRRRATRRSWRHECRAMAARAGRCADCAGWLSLVTEPMVQASGAALEHVAVMLTWVGRIALRDVLTRQQVARSATSLHLGRLSAASQLGLCTPCAREGHARAAH